jgi:hypothetical protein
MTNATILARLGRPILVAITAPIDPVTSISEASTTRRPRWSLEQPLFHFQLRLCLPTRRSPWPMSRLQQRSRRFVLFTFHQPTLCQPHHPQRPLMVLALMHPGNYLLLRLRQTERVWPSNQGRLPRERDNLLFKLGQNSSQLSLVIKGAASSNHVVGMRGGSFLSHSYWPLHSYRFGNFPVL